MAGHRVQALLMGGQACVLYGAAEFSRDVDFAILPEAGEPGAVQSAMKALKAHCIAVPPLEADYLLRGHAVHFRCQHPDAKDIRVDIMAKLRGVDDFGGLWERRTTLTSADGTAYEMLSPDDLVQAKKTQRDKDWVMLRRLVEVYYFQNRRSKAQDKIRFWLKELRTPELLLEAAAAQPKLSREAGRRAASANARSGPGSWRGGETFNSGGTGIAGKGPALLDSAKSGIGGAASSEIATVGFHDERPQIQQPSGGFSLCQWVLCS